MDDLMKFLNDYGYFIFIVLGMVIIYGALLLRAKGFQNLAKELNLSYVEVGTLLSKTFRLSGTFNHREVSIYTESKTKYLKMKTKSSNNKTMFTVVRINHPSPYNFSFQIIKEGFLNSIISLADGKDIQIGDPEIDKNFLIRSNHENAIKELLQKSGFKTALLEIFKFSDNMILDENCIKWEKKGIHYSVEKTKEILQKMDEFQTKIS